MIINNLRLSNDTDDTIYSGLFDELEQATQTASWIYYINSHAISFSANFPRLFGLPAEHMEGLTDLLPLLDEKGQEALRETILSMEENQEIPMALYHAVLGNKKLKLKQWGTSKVDSEGEPYLAGFLSVEKSDEFAPGAMQEKNQQLHLAAMVNDASIDRVLALDADFNIIAWNRMCELVSGIPREKAIGTNFLNLFPDDQIKKSLRPLLLQTLKGFKTFLPADHSPYTGGYYENHFIPLRDKNDDIVGVLNVIHDVAHRVKAENELKNLNKELAIKNNELKQKNIELTSLMHIASHDIKNPVRKVHSFVNMIVNSEDNISETNISYLKRIEKSISHIAALTDDMLSFINLGNDEKEVGEVNLNHVLLSAKHRLWNIVEQTHAVIESEKLPVINGQRLLLTTLLYNIISNAIKFQKPGNQPRISISSQYLPGSEIQHPEALAAAQYLCISIADNGIGFEEKVAEKIFMMFTVLQPDTFPGAGIGLAMSKKIVALHHGFIAADSNPGVGSVFYCYFPVND
ncbi:sensor histidine kinase [Taibaiella soli]|uniref:histidine kinase n=1 Tax=Taibaiella soli TaxID=1649169 RepID=A0A2W2BE17_9BACT|nr:PAS domain-containing sensor histidine kinase [Taibaiella soli]PZF71836.1 hypothetical protein DN068_17400 [Taibaiella soli]